MWRSEEHSTPLFRVCQARWKDELHDNCMRRLPMKYTEKTPPFCGANDEILQGSIAEVSPFMNSAESEEKKTR
jgi:hypothetical protein